MNRPPTFIAIGTGDGCCPFAVPAVWPTPGCFTCSEAAFGPTGARTVLVDPVFLPVLGSRAGRRDGGVTHPVKCGSENKLPGWHRPEVGGSCPAAPTIACHSLPVPAVAEARTGCQEGGRL